MTEPAYTPAADRYGSGMPFRRCGRSGILLPAVSLGLWKNFGAETPYADSRAMVHYAFDHGITHYDLANNYGPPPGSAETTMGRIVEESLRPYRDELFIATKAGYEMWPGPYGNWGSRKSLTASLDQSLRRMKLDYVDLFYTHRYDPETPIEETLQALVDIVRSGKALYVGISRWPTETTRMAFNYLREHDTPCLAYQGRLNLIDRSMQQSGLTDLLRKEDVGFVSFSPLAQGLLTDRYLNGIPDGSRMAQGGSLKESSLTPALLERLKVLNKLAEQRGQTLAEMALAWVLKNELVTSVIIGASSVKQLEDNLKAIGNTHFSEEELKKIDKS